MKILIVEDNENKREIVEYILKNAGVQFHIEKAINSALKYIHDHHDEIDGIILDLGLPRFENDLHPIPLGGLDIPDEMEILELDIPILINSFDAGTVKYEDYLFDVHNIKGETQPYTSSHADDINSFISSLEKGEF